MPSSLAITQKLPFLSLTAGEFDALAVGWGWPRFRSQQVRDFVYGKLLSDPAGMTSLSNADRQALARLIEIAPASVVAHQASSDRTQKLLLTWDPSTGSGQGGNAETVMIPDGARRTACVSSQVGCPVGCKFCASGINGVKGNLSAGQIVEQVFRLNQILGQATEARTHSGTQGGGRDEGASETSRISNVVFMGTGEPLANYANVMQAIRVLHDPKCLNMSARRITISTVGVPAKMCELAHEELPINLAISLHAPNEKLRKELIPWAEHFALGEILEAGQYYFQKTGREITLEYILLHGVNDQIGHARELATVCKTLRANVNLIRYNEVSGLPYKRPIGKDVLAFQDVLIRAGVNAHVRKSRGRDIDAACGQLRRKETAKAGAA